MNNIETITVEDLFNSENFIIVKIYSSIVYGVSIKVGIRGQVRPSSVGCNHYQSTYPEKFIELNNLNEPEVNSLCLKHRGIPIFKMRQFIQQKFR